MALLTGRPRRNATDVDVLPNAAKINSFSSLLCFHVFSAYMLNAFGFLIESWWTFIHKEQLAAIQYYLHFQQ